MHLTNCAAAKLIENARRQCFPEDCAHQACAWRNVDAAEIEAVGIPAGTDGRMIRNAAGCMLFDGMDQQIEACHIKGELSVDCFEILFQHRGRARSVLPVRAVIETAGVMVDGKQAADIHVRAFGPRGNSDRVFFNPAPMCRTMDGCYLHEKEFFRMGITIFKGHTFHWVTL